VLAGRFLARYCASNGLPLDTDVLAQAMTALQAYHWPATSPNSKALSRRAALLGAWPDHP